MTAPPTTYQSPLDRETSFDAAQCISTVVINTLSSIASVASSSPFGPAALACLAILSTVKNTKGNKEAFRELAKDACELVYAVVDKDSSDGKRSPQFEQQVKHLVFLRVLQSIEEFSKNRASKSIVRRIVMVPLDAEKIKKYRAELNHSLRVFDIQSHVSIRENVEEILKRIQEDQKAERAKAPRARSPPPGMAGIFVCGDTHNMRVSEFVGGDKVTNQTSYFNGIPWAGTPAAMFA
ncbi:hypothetical protein K438DRAFT_2114052 [Mycena galopus ATCC 62051]|nr:hypothetical protein K438DRAFT_2114052 [Mycena galopus ATCC 62051]